jgi:hypothetical protein
VQLLVNFMVLSPKSKPKVVHHDKLKPYVGENRPTWFTGRQVSVRRCSDDLNRSLKSFIE